MRDNVVIHTDVRVDRRLGELIADVMNTVPDQLQSQADEVGDASISNGVVVVKHGKPHYLAVLLIYKDADLTDIYVKEFDSMAAMNAFLDSAEREANGELQ